MPVIRQKHEKNYTPLPNKLLRDKRLSLKDRGLLSLMLSLPDDWDFSVKGLCKITGEGRDAISKTVKRLEKAGYVKREQQRDQKGKLGGCVWYVYDVASPSPENPSPENQSLENQSLENQSLENQSLENRHKQSKENKVSMVGTSYEAPTNKVQRDKEREGAQRPSRFVPPTVDEVYLYAAEQGYSVDAKQFVDYYTSNGWKVGKNPMKDWRASVRTWERREREKRKPTVTEGYLQIAREEGCLDPYADGT